MIIITSILLAGLPVIMLFVIFAILDIAVRLERWNKRRQKRRSPFTGQLLRGPGESLREAIDDLRAEMIAYIFLALFWPVLVSAMYVSLSHYSQTQVTPYSLGPFALVGVGVFVYGLRRFLNLRRGIDALREGLDGETAVGQELNQLLRDGFWVFHDVPGDGFNIDHVVVGPSGVFAVETKTRKKPTTDNRTADAQVAYDGNCLQFPGWIENKPIEQASRQATWLAKWLRRSTGDQAIRVCPVVALPGWYVTLTNNLTKKTNSVTVINPKNLKCFTHNRGNLSEPQIERIVYQLDRVCRDVAPFEAGKDPAESVKDNQLAKKVKNGTVPTA